MDGALDLLETLSALPINISVLTVCHFFYYFYKNNIFLYIIFIFS